MLEKLIWISAFMLVGARHPGATIGVVEKEYRTEVSRLCCQYKVNWSVWKIIETKWKLETCMANLSFTKRGRYQNELWVIHFY